MTRVGVGVGGGGTIGRQKRRTAKKGAWLVRACKTAAEKQ